MDTRSKHLLPKIVSIFKKETPPASSAPVFLEVPPPLPEIAPIEDEENTEVPEEEPEPEIEPETIDPISLYRPELQFRVLNALKKQGLFFIDMESGRYINGLLYLPSIGLTFTPPPPKIELPGMGFLNLASNKGFGKQKKSDSIEVDAVLFFQYDGEECRTGIVPENLAYQLFIKIWNDLDFVLWEQIIEKVVADLTLHIEGQNHPMVNIAVGSTFVPNSPTEQNRLTINFPQTGNEVVNAVSPYRYRVSRYHQE